MIISKKEKIFKTLNACRIQHITQPSLFPDTESEKNTSTTGWMYSDLHNLFGENIFPQKPSFSAHIWQNMVMPRPTNSTRGFPQLENTNIDFYNNHVVQITHPYTLDNHYFKNAKDFKLSPYACWCMSRKNPYMIFARTYFISPIIDPNMTFDTMNAWCYQFARVHLREQLSRYTKKLNGLLYKHGVNFHDFSEQNTIALFNETPATIRNKNALNTHDKRPLADYMGSMLLFYKQEILQNIIKAITQEDFITHQEIFDIAYNEFSAIRTKFITEMGIDPIRDITHTPIQQIQSILMQKERDFINKYAYLKTK